MEEDKHEKNNRKISKWDIMLLAYGPCALSFPSVFITACRLRFPPTGGFDNVGDGYSSR